MDLTLTGLLVWLLACYGGTFLVCSASVTAAPRRWLVERSSWAAGLLACYFCTGFWVSLGSAYGLSRQVTWSFLQAFAGATFCYFLDAVIRRLEAGGDVFDERIAAD